MPEDGLLSQDDIDALTASLQGEAAPAGARSRGDAPKPGALREPLRIFCEQASQVAGTLLNKSVDFGIRDVAKFSAAPLRASAFRESLLLSAAFEKGLAGEIHWILPKTLAAALADLMMMGDGKSAYQEDHKDAVTELMNQIMGSSCTAFGSKYRMGVSAGQAKAAEFGGDGSSFGLLPSEEEGAAMAELGIAVEAFSAFPGFLVLSPSLAFSLQEEGPSAEPVPAPPPDEHWTAGSPLSAPPAALPRLSAKEAPNIQLLLDIPLQVTIELGRTRLSIRKILELGPGSIIELDRMAGEPVDLLVNDKVVARGEVVVVDEYFGVRILSLVSPEERIKQLR